MPPSQVLPNPNSIQTKEDYAYMAKLYFASLKFGPSLFGVVIFIDKIS